MNDKERIGKQIAELRKEYGYSQVKLAELTGLGSGHIARIELGRYNVGIDTLTKIVSVFGLKVDFVKE